MGFCPNCGTKNEENLNFCTNCGTNLNQNVPNNFQQPVYNQPVYNQPMYNQPQVKKNSKATASMVLGIIGLAWGLISLLSLGRIEEGLIEAYVENGLTPETTKIAFGIGYNILSLPCGIVGLILGFLAGKDSKATVGKLTSAIALGIAIIAFIVIFSVTL